MRIVPTTPRRLRVGSGNTRIPTHSSPNRRDRGQAAIVVVATAAALLVVLVVALASMGRTSADRTRAQTAADAAALASVDGDRAAADELATVHGATVVTWMLGPRPDEVTVTVRLRNVTATARASMSP